MKLKNTLDTLKRVRKLLKENEDKIEKCEISFINEKIILIKLRYYEGLVISLFLNWNENRFVYLTSEFVLLQDYMCKDLPVKRRSISLYNNDSIEYYLKNYREFHQKYIKVYKKQSPLLTKLNSLFEAIPLDQVITIIGQSQLYYLIIHAVSCFLHIGTFTTIYIRKDSLVDLEIKKKYSVGNSIFLNCKGITLEVGIKLLNQFYTDFFKSKKRTYKGVFSL